MTKQLEENIEKGIYRVGDFIVPQKSKKLPSIKERLQQKMYAQVVEKCLSKKLERSF